MSRLQSLRALRARRVLPLSAAHPVFGTSVSSSILNVKRKVHFTVEQAMKAQTGSRGVALLFPYPGAWGSVVVKALRY